MVASDGRECPDQLGGRGRWGERPLEGEGRRWDADDQDDARSWAPATVTPWLDEHSEQDDRAATGLRTTAGGRFQRMSCESWSPGPRRLDGDVVVIETR